MVTGDHLDPDSGRAAGGDRGRRLRARRIEQAEQAEEHEAPVDIVEAELAMLGRGGARCDRDDPLGVGGQGFDPAVPVARIDGPGEAVGVALPGAHLEDALGRALDQHVAVPFVVVMQGRHELVRGIERDQVGAWPARQLDTMIERGLERDRQQGAVGRIARELPALFALPELGIVAEQARAQGLDQVGQPIRLDHLVAELEAPFGRIAAAGHFDHVVGSDHGLNGQLVEREGPRFVRADHRDRAQGFDRRQAADDGVLARHAGDAESEGDGHDRRQALGDGRDGEADRSEEHLLGGVAAQEPAEQEGPDGKAEDRDGQPAPEGRHLAQQRCRERLDLVQERRDPAELGLPARGHDHARAAAVGNQGAGVGHRGAIAQRGACGNRPGPLVDRLGLAGQCRLLQQEAARADQAKVRRHLVARLQDDDVAGHQLLGGDPGPLPLPQHERLGREHLADRIQCPLGPALLDEAHDRIDQNDAQDHRGVDPFAEPRGDQGRAEQHVDQDVVKLGEEAPEWTPRRSRLEAVGTVGREAPPGLVAVQPAP